MSLVEIEKAIEELPNKQRFELFDHIYQLIEDYLDIKKVEASLAEGDFMSWEQAKQEIYAERNRNQADS